MYTISTFYVDNIFFNLLLFLNKNDAQMLNENALQSLSIELNILEMIFFSSNKTWNYPMENNRQLDTHI